MIVILKCTLVIQSCSKVFEGYNKKTTYDIKTEFSLIRYCTHGCWCLTLVFSCDIQNIRVEPLHGFHQLYVVILNAGETTSILDKNILESYLLC